MYPILLHLGVLAIPSYGAVTALGVLLALMAAQVTARRLELDGGRVWNLCVLAILTALVVARLLLVAMNWQDLRVHPMWLLGLAMIHSPLLAGIGVGAGGAAAAVYAWRVKLPLLRLADAMAAPVALGMAVEQVASLLAGSGYGTSTDSGWGVVYTNALAARWSGTPLGVPVYPVQLYAALADLLVAVACWLLLARRKQGGDVAGAWLLLMGAGVFLTEMFRDREGRGSVFGGLMDGPQVVAVAMVALAAVVLWEKKSLVLIKE